MAIDKRSLEVDPVSTRSATTTSILQSRDSSSLSLIKIGLEVKGEQFGRLWTFKWLTGSEAELLHHHIMTALESLPAQAPHERHFPGTDNFQLGHGNVNAPNSQFDHNATDRGGAFNRDVAPDQRAVV